MNTVSKKLFRELAELVGRKSVMAPNRMFQQLTEKKEKNVDAHARRRLKKKQLAFYEASPLNYQPLLSIFS